MAAAVGSLMIIEASNLSSVLGCLPLSIIEVGWHCDHSILHLCLKVALCYLLHVTQDKRRYFLREKFLQLSTVLDLNLDSLSFLHGDFSGRSLF